MLTHPEGGRVISAVSTCFVTFVRLDLTQKMTDGWTVGFFSVAHQPNAYPPYFEGGDSIPGLSTLISTLQQVELENSYVACSFSNWRGVIFQLRTSGLVFWVDVIS